MVDKFGKVIIVTINANAAIKLLTSDFSSDEYAKTICLSSIFPISIPFILGKADITNINMLKPTQNTLNVQCMAGTGINNGINGNIKTSIAKIVSISVNNSKHISSLIFVVKKVW